jgi:predicted MFS family arabinose efflux permease
MGAVNSAIPVCWSTWLTKGISDEPESGGGLLVGAIQLSIMLGGAFGGLLFDHISAAATLVGGTSLLVLASLTVWNGNRTRPDVAIESGSSSRSLEHSYRPVVSLCESGD